MTAPFHLAMHSRVSVHEMSCELTGWSHILSRKCVHGKYCQQFQLWVLVGLLSHQYEAHWQCHCKQPARYRMGTRTGKFYSWYYSCSVRCVWLVKEMWLQEMLEMASTWWAGFLAESDYFQRTDGQAHFPPNQHPCLHLPNQNFSEFYEVLSCFI